MEKYLVEGNLHPLLDIDDNYRQYESQVNSGKNFLDKLSEKSLFEQNKEVLRVNHFLPFDEFSKPVE